MFQGLINWFQSALVEFYSWAKKNTDWLSTWLNPVWAVMVLVAGWTWTTASYVSAAVNSVVTAFDAWVVPNLNPAMPGGLAYAASVANTFFPLSETVVFTIAYMTMVLALTVYRLIKSWIPTLS